MLINISIKNFRSIKNEITLSFEANNTDELSEFYIVRPKEGMRLLKLGIIYGANASGKTTILLALNFLRSLILEPFEKKTENFNFEPFLFDADTPSENTFFTIEFIQNKIKYHYEIELNKNSIIREKLFNHNPNKALVYERKTNASKQFTEITFGTKIKIKKESRDALIGNTLWNNTVLGGYLKTNFESKELQDVIDWFENKLEKMIEPKISLVSLISNHILRGKIKKEHIIEILKKADFGISNIFIKNGDNNEFGEKIINMLAKEAGIPYGKVKHLKEQNNLEATETLLQHSVGHLSYLLPIAEESAGTKRYYEFSGLLSLIIAGKKILPIDELESSLHPDLIKHFLLTFLVNSHEAQLIATTHYRELLMERDILRNDAIWFTEKKEDGSTDLFSLNDFDSSVVRNTSSIYNAYKIGKLGAVPKLNDYYLNLANEEEKI